MSRQIPSLAVLDAVVDVALDHRIKAHRDRKAGRLSVADYLAQLAAVREVEDRLEPLRRQAAAPVSRALELSLRKGNPAGVTIGGPCEPTFPTRPRQPSLDDQMTLLGETVS